MRYYVVSDVHGFYKELRSALDNKGFFDDKEPHKLIMCGDALDRGCETLEMQRFMLNLFNNDELIFIRGNHEDLMLDMLDKFDEYRFSIAIGASHHNSNGTWNSALQLSGMDEFHALRNTKEFLQNIADSDFLSTLVPNSLNYFETEHYVFVHGWIPCFSDTQLPVWHDVARRYRYNPNWRTAKEKDWENARWMNGMDMAVNHGIKVNGKTVVCGHFHTSYGHSRFEQKGDEFESDADFTPFYSDGIIALDACTAYSGIVNCIVIED